MTNEVGATSGCKKQWKKLTRTVHTVLLKSQVQDEILNCSYYVDWPLLRFNVFKVKTEIQNIWHLSVNAIGYYKKA